MLLCLGHVLAWACWQLQHGCVLASGQFRYQHDLTVRQFQGVMVEIGLEMRDRRDGDNRASSLLSLNSTTSIGSPHFGSVERVTRAGMGQSHRQLAPTDLVGAFFFGVTELPDVEVSKLQSKSVEARPSPC